MDVYVKWVLMSPYAQLPVYSTEGAAGQDLYAAEAVTIWPGKVCAVSTGLAVQLPVGYEMQVRQRSGMGFKFSCIALDGTVDEDYRGIVNVGLFVLGDEPYHVKIGDRVAQIIVVQVPRVRNVLCMPGELSMTERGAGGLGSTGR